MLSIYGEDESVSVYYLYKIIVKGRMDAALSALNRLSSQNLANILKEDEFWNLS